MQVLVFLSFIFSIREIYYEFILSKVENNASDFYFTKIVSKLKIISITSKYWNNFRTICFQISYSDTSGKFNALGISLFSHFRRTIELSNSCLFFCNITTTNQLPRSSFGSKFAKWSDVNVLHNLEDCIRLMVIQIGRNAFRVCQICVFNQNFSFK